MARSLLPREHGAYVQLATPLLVALIACGVTSAGLLFAIAAGLAFVSNEPLLIALGHRGRRLRESDGRRARAWFAVLAAGALVAGVAGLVLAPPDARLAAAAVAVPSAVLFVLGWRKQERTFLGETTAAIALTGAAAPVAVAAGMSLPNALALWLAWAVGYACTVVAVHRVIERHKRPPKRIDRVAAITLSTMTLASVTASVFTWHALVVIPFAASAAALVIAPPPATKLRAIGFALVGASLVSATLAISLGAA